MADGRHLKIGISPYLSEKSSEIDEILYTQQILNWMNVTWSKLKKLHWTDSEFDRTYFLVIQVYDTTLVRWVIIILHVLMTNQTDSKDDMVEASKFLGIIINNSSVGCPIIKSLKS